MVIRNLLQIKNKLVIDGYSYEVVEKEYLLCMHKE